MASILRALRRNFSDYAVYESESGDLVIVAVAAGRSAAGARRRLRLRRPGGRDASNWGSRRRTTLRGLRVARTATSDTIARAIDAPPNSDYFPYVDQNAARARFMRSSADELRSLRKAPVPLLDLIEGETLSERLSQPRPLAEPLDALRQGVYAEQAAAFAAALPGLAAGRAPRGTVGREPRGTWRRVRTLPAAASLAEEVWDRIVVVAAETIPQLPPAEARAMWRQLADGKCAAALSARQQLWLALFVATRGPRRALDPAGHGAAPVRCRQHSGAMAIPARSRRCRARSDAGPQGPGPVCCANMATGYRRLPDASAGMPISMASPARRRTPCAEPATASPPPRAAEPARRPRALREISTTSNRACTTGTMTSCASRSSGCSVNGSWPRFQQLTISWPW